MNEKTKKTGLALTVSAFVLMLAAFILDRILSRSGSSAVPFLVQNAWVSVVLETLTLACAFIYILKDGTKEAALFHKGFTGAFLLMYNNFFHMTIISAISATAEKQLMLHLFIIVLLIGYSAILLLTFARNQGKAISQGLAAIAAVSELVILFFFIFEGFSPVMVLTFSSKILMINLLYTMVEVKYQDKDARGTI